MVLMDGVIANNNISFNLMNEMKNFAKQTANLASQIKVSNSQKANLIKQIIDSNKNTKLMVPTE